MKIDYKKLPFVFLVSAILFTALFLLIVGISVWILIFGAIWFLFYFIFIAQKISLSFVKHETAWLFFGMLLVISLVFIFAVESPKTKTTNVKTLTADECAPIYETYNDKALDVTANGVVGTVGIKIDQNDCRAKVYYNMMITESLTKNYRQEDLNYDDYEYVSAIREESASRKDSFGTVEIFPIFDYPGTFPTNVFEFGSTDNGATGKIIRGEGTNKFYIGWSSSYIFTEKSIERLLSRNVLELVDSSRYVTKEATSEQGTSYYTDSNKAAGEGPIVKTYRLNYTER